MRFLAFQQIRDLDLRLLATVLILGIIGVVMVYSATQTEQPGVSGLWQKQVLWLILGLISLAIFTALPFRYLHALAWPIYIGSLALLILVLMAPAAANTHRWFVIGSIQLQPSEMAKIATVIILARLLSSREWKRRGWVRIAAAAVLSLLPMGLVLVEPDLGTSLIFPMIFFSLLYWNQVPLSTLFYLISPLASMLAVVSMPSWIVFMLILTGAFRFFKTEFKTAVPLFIMNAAIGSLAPIIWHGLKEYQRRRIMIFVNPGLDPKGAGWHVLQSKIAIGSGGLLGRGFLQGTQKKLSFLPAQHTDFIFSTIGEEFGFLGCLIVLLLFAWVIYSGFAIAQRARNEFAGLTAAGLTTILLFQVVLNIGMTLGVLPVTGIPLPFLSYGGSSVITMMSLVGIILGIGLRRYEY